jgi:hypothetical protein
MTHSTRLISQGFAGLLVCSVLFLSSVGSTNAQQQQPNQANSPVKRAEGGRDPFRKYEAPRVIVKKSNLVTPPSIEERISQYRAQKQAAMSARIVAPKPTTALLLGEVQVVGISRSPRGYAAIVEATPIKMSFVIYPGERFYDGQLVAIEENRLVFRRETVFTDGRKERSVELKALRQQNAINGLTAVKTAPAPAAVEADKSPEKPTTADKP